MKRFIAPAALAFGAFATLMPTSASAQTADDWKFNAIIYGWFPSIDGKTSFPTRFGGSDVNVDASTIMTISSSRSWALWRRRRAAGARSPTPSNWISAGRSRRPAT